MAKQPQILNLDEILADEQQRTIVWKGKNYEIAGVTGEAYLRFLGKQTLINKAIASKDLEAQWKASLELLAFLAPGLPLDEMQKLPFDVFQQVVTFVMAVFQEGTGDPSLGSGQADGRQTTDEEETDDSLGESTSP